VCGGSVRRWCAVAERKQKLWQAKTHTFSIFLFVSPLAALSCPPWDESEKHLCFESGRARAGETLHERGLTHDDADGCVILRTPFRPTRSSSPPLTFTAVPARPPYFVQPTSRRPRRSCRPRRTPLMASPPRTSRCVGEQLTRRRVLFSSARRRPVARGQKPMAARPPRVHRCATCLSPHATAGGRKLAHG
jgi:hypothetical protein